MSCCAAGTEGALDIERAGHALPTAEELRLASRDLGDGLLQTDLSVPAVHCGACISTIERALRARPEVERARVNLSTKRVSVVWKDKIGEIPTDPLEFARAIAATGYESHLFTAAEEASDAMRNRLIRAVAVSGFAATNIMLLSVSVWSGADSSTRDLFHWISAMIAAPALIYAGRFFYQSAWNALKHGRSNMDVPIAIGITLSYFISLWETIHHGEQAYFDATASLLFFLLIGRTLDHIMRDRARSAISGLARLSPRGAMVVGEDGSREYRALEDVRVGDHVAIAAGDRIPVDGVIVTGASDMDVSIINGESAPLQVGVGDVVQAGTLSLTGSLELEATATAKNSFLAEVINLMEAAEGGRARYRRIADRAAQFYAPAVHLTALLTFLSWGLYDGDWKHALLVAVAVLIITCPCALGLAVPVVQVVAAGRLFKAGIMVKDGSAMERLAEIDSVAFDKTGTLTIGKPQLVDAGAIDAEAFAIASGLARHSRHPLSQALSRVASVPSKTFDAVREIPGAGIEAETAKGIYRLGSRRFACAQSTAEMGDHTYSEVVLSLDGREVQAFRFEDTLRPGAEKAIALLKGQGFTVGILSGDRSAVVSALARRVGIDNWKAELSPRDKAAFCAAVEAEGHKLLMVGDGINDAPALAAAHVSIAPATAADVGRQAADFIFVRQNLDSVAFAIEASRRAGRLIRENFVLAIGYNIVAVPIAILGFASPLIAAVAMSTSSIIVVLNALRLNRLALKEEGEGGQSIASVGFAGPNAGLAS
ncbi:MULTISPECIES: cation-translocating P-type ATPase [Alphaproteobacteria]|uniref:Copper-translocating P-type ATPase n=2 Tax=Alphaproteobacteria TaxID=28211 RepID=A0A512HHX5_9HYPH|nr:MULTISPECIES: cation-translocating P-type ATPase [Alphaproteobacteria]GEO85039.1 copper-translocating P-type ATPase [Ciceribacter naphthalenivorans]GLR22973.1 copper-translocating P-type ATPase [Ciceribacter naphthalenivorans]GLT05829.1 copper-translocating P-type ATPase [Sphingomonas psychrolutea]